MSLRKVIFSVFILGVMLDNICFANMASPYWKGTISGSAMTSRDIDILNEKIFIQIHKQDHTAFYKIDYYIKCDSSGMQVPLLFYAIDYKDDFKVWIDNKKVELIDVPEGLTEVNRPPLQNFHESLSSFDWVQNLGREPKLKDLKYFEVDLSKGVHQIHIEYTSRAWVNLLDWVKKYSFKYSLFPAKFWRSFNSLEITLNTTENNSEIITNLGEATEGNLASLATWKFNKLPADEIEISYQPQIVSVWANMLLSVKPLKMVIFFAIIFIIVHFISIRKYRIRYPEKKNSWVVIAGSILIPFLILLWYMYTFELIDAAIGPEASQYHGYTFLILFNYPLIMPVYWIIMWQIDKWLKRKYMVKIDKAFIN